MTQYHRMCREWILSTPFWQWLPCLKAIRLRTYNLKPTANLGHFKCFSHPPDEVKQRKGSRGHSLWRPQDPYVHITPSSSFSYLRYEMYYTIRTQQLWTIQKSLEGQVNLKLNKFPFSLCFSLPLHFDRTIPWHIHRLLPISSRSWPSLIGATRNKSKQDAGCVPNRAHNTPKTLHVSRDCPLSLHDTLCCIFAVLLWLMYDC